MKAKVPIVQKPLEAIQRDHDYREVEVIPTRSALRKSPEKFREYVGHIAQRLNVIAINDNSFDGQKRREGSVFYLFEESGSKDGSDVQTFRREVMALTELVAQDHYHAFSSSKNPLQLI